MLRLAYTSKGQKVMQKDYVKAMAPPYRKGYELHHRHSAPRLDH